MAAIEFITIPSDILGRADLSDKAKMLAGLIKSFNGKGLFMGNDELGRSICASADHISKLLGVLKLKGLVEIQNGQSRFRKIFYSGQNAGVQGGSTPSFRETTPSFRETTPAKTTDINKKKVKELTLSKESAHCSIPSLGEIQSYIAERNLSVLAQAFFDYYNESGWVDSRGQKVRNWKQKLLTWNSHEGSRQNGNNYRFNRNPAFDTEGAIII